MSAVTDEQLREWSWLCEARGECAGPLTTYPSPGIAHVAIVCRDNWDDVIRWLKACVDGMPALIAEVERLRPVYAAAKAWGEVRNGLGDGVTWNLKKAVDAAIAKEPTP